MGFYKHYGIQIYQKRASPGLQGLIDILLPYFSLSLTWSVLSNLLLLIKLPLFPYFSSISFSKSTFQKMRLKTSLVMQTIRHRVKVLTEACLGISLIRAISPKASPSLQQHTILSSRCLQARRIPSMMMKNLEPTSPQLITIQPYSYCTSISTSQIFYSSYSLKDLKNYCFIRVHRQRVRFFIIHIFLKWTQDCRSRVQRMPSSLRQQIEACLRIMWSKQISPKVSPTQQFLILLGPFSVYWMHSKIPSSTKYIRSPQSPSRHTSRSFSIFSLFIFSMSSPISFSEKLLNRKLLIQKNRMRIQVFSSFRSPFQTLIELRHDFSEDSPYRFFLALCSFSYFICLNSSSSMVSNRAQSSPSQELLHSVLDSMPLRSRNHFVQYSRISSGFDFMMLVIRVEYKGFMLALKYSRAYLSDNSSCSLRVFCNSIQFQNTAHKTTLFNLYKISQTIAINNSQCLQRDY